MAGSYTIIVHGGAWEWPRETWALAEAGCRDAAASGAEVLEKGGKALDAVEAAVRSLEDNPIFNAGRGACYTSEKTIEVDAGIQDGVTGRFGAVACVPNLLHPVSLARRLMEDNEHAFLAGEGALKYARHLGLQTQQFTDLATDMASRNYAIALEKSKAATSGGDTVGACAIDQSGNLAVAVSTGGTTFKRPGRVGDSPVIGSGFNADNAIGASCATGRGEAIMQCMLTRRTLEFLNAGLSCAQAAEKGVEEVKLKTEKLCGVIIIDKKGRTGLYHSTTHMPFALKNAENSLESGIKWKKG